VSLNTSPGKIVIISSPSGGGKTSICRAILEKERRDENWTFSVSYTTRQPREGEVQGREYYFVDEPEFDRLVADGFFAEHFRVHLYKYGTPRGPMEEVLRNGGVMLLDVDVQGARRIVSEYPDAISIFVLPPSVSVLQKRLEKRGTETPEQQQVRYKNALEEMRSLYEYRAYGFEYVVINEELDRAVRNVLSIVEAHACRLDKIDPEHIRRITG